MSIRDTGALPEGDAFENAVREFKASFRPTEATPAGAVGAGVPGTPGHMIPETLETE